MRWFSLNEWLRDRCRLLYTVCRKSVTDLYQTYIKLTFKYKPFSYHWEDHMTLTVNVLYMIQGSWFVSFVFFFCLSGSFCLTAWQHSKRGTGILYEEIRSGRAAGEGCTGHIWEQQGSGEVCIGVTDGIKVGVELHQGSAVGCNGDGQVKRWAQAGVLLAMTCVDKTFICSESGGAGGRKPAEVEVCNEDKRNRS